MAFLEGIGIKGFRSFGTEMQLIHPLKRINLFIGANNSGKSNILLFVSKILRQDVHRRDAQSVVLDQDDLPQGLDVSFRFALGCSKESPLRKQVRTTSDPLNIFALESVMNSEAVSKSTEYAWFIHDRSLNICPSMIKALHQEPPINELQLQNLWRDLNPNTTPAQAEFDYYFSDILRDQSPINVPLEPIYLIPAIRKVTSSTDKNDIGGEGLIVALSKLQQPSVIDRKDKELFEKINAFVRTVTGNSKATLSIPWTLETINVQIEERILPLESLGTGIHEVIILAAAATVSKTGIVCIEEPELHLHPLLQKQLVNYLVENTEHQYFITTHSAHILDTPEAEIFHVRLIDGWSKVERAETDQSKFDICADLGYRASDLMQANCIVWVEGPTDRTHISRWLKAVDSDLKDGLHYSLMTYGGRLLEHLSTLDQQQIEAEAKAFISLRQINRYIAVVMDRDQKNQNQKLEAFKLRVIEELEKSTGGINWLTEGHSIESYYPEETLKQGLKAIHPRSKIPEKIDQYSNPAQYIGRSGRLTDAKKVELADWLVTNANPPLERMNLRNKLEELSHYIRKANGLPPLSREGT